MGCLWVGRCGHLGGVSFHISHELRHVKLVKERKEILLNSSLNGTEGVAMSANTGGGRGKVKEGSQPLDLNVDSGGAPEWRVVVEVGF